MLGRSPSILGRLPPPGRLKSVPGRVEGRGGRGLLSWGRFVLGSEGLFAPGRLPPDGSDGRDTLPPVPPNDGRPPPKEGAPPDGRLTCGRPPALPNEGREGLGRDTFGRDILGRAPPIPDMLGLGDGRDMLGRAPPPPTCPIDGRPPPPPRAPPPRPPPPRPPPRWASNSDVTKRMIVSATIVPNRRPVMLLGLIAKAPRK
jgi:hypothetical protein